MTCVDFRDYRDADRAACLALFDANCPAFFAPNERDDYEHWLSDASERGYQLACMDEVVVGAFGLRADTSAAAALNWIMISPDHQGRGIGGAMMARVIDEARAARIGTVHIAASQHSAPFFARFGAREIRQTPDGWGLGMHRVDMVLDGPAT